MRTEKGVALVVYKKKRGKKRFLVLKRNKNWEGWEIPKGHLEDEDYTKTIKQELREEAGIPEEKIEEIENLNQDLEWTYTDEEGQEVKREYRGYIVETSKAASVDVTQNPHEEHETGFFMKKEDVKSLLTYENQKELLNLAT
ncbi:NUDIX domain-containing protein [Nanohaloarchaea archaeon]|nr:NUDIX domain-containing protein [Candidatus Nanohaloarchaea archaeon]